MTSGEDLGAVGASDSTGAAPAATRWAGVPWLAVGFFGLGALLRLWAFWIPDLWIDEYGTWWTIAPASWLDVARRATAVHGQSPLYYLGVKLTTAVLGVSPLALRLPSVLAAIAVVALAYPLGLRIFRDRRTATLAVAAFAVSQTMIWYAQESRPYALALLATMLSFLFFLAALDTERPRDRIGYLLATTALFYVHYLFAVAVLIQVLHLIRCRGWSRLLSPPWRWTYLLLVLACGPGALQVLRLFGRRADLTWLAPASWITPLHVALQTLDPPVFAATAVAVLIAGVTRWREGESPREGRQLVVLWWFLPILVLAVVPELFGVTLLSTRYALCVYPAVALVHAWLLGSADRTGWRPWLPVTVFLVSSGVLNLLPALQAGGTFGLRPPQGWAKAADFLQRSAQPGDLVILRTGFVEADLLARPRPDPMIETFVNWPLTAHLSSAPPFDVVAMTVHTTGEAKPYVMALLAQAAQRRRVWVVGVGQAGVAEWLVSRARFQRLGETTYGLVHVIGLTRDGP